MGFVETLQTSLFTLRILQLYLLKMCQWLLTLKGMLVRSILRPWYGHPDSKRLLHNHRFAPASKVESIYVAALSLLEETSFRDRQGEVKAKPFEASKVTACR